MTGYITKKEVKMLDDKAKEIENIIVKRFTKLKDKLDFFVSDLTNEIMYGGFGTHYFDIHHDIFLIIKDMIPEIKYDVKKIVDLLPKYESRLNKDNIL